MIHVIHAIRVAVVLLALAACNKRADAPPTNERPKPIAAPERQRGGDACKMYVQALCACAAGKPALQDRCDRERALPEALDLALAVDDQPDAVREDIITAQAQARNIIASCVQKTAALPGDGCR